MIQLYNRYIHAMNSWIAPDHNSCELDASKLSVCEDNLDLVTVSHSARPQSCETCHNIASRAAHDTWLCLLLGNLHKDSDPENNPEFHLKAA